MSLRPLSKKDPVVKKGKAVTRRLTQREEASPWNHYNHLTIAGWSLAWERRAGPDPRELSVNCPYDAFMFSKDHAYNIHSTWSHLNPSTVGNRTYEPTQAFYTGFYNPRAIFLQRGEGPDYHGYDNDITGSNVVILKHWSDVAYLQWSEHCRRTWGTPLHNLRQIVHLNIDNQRTIEVVVTALHGSKQTLRQWQHNLVTYPIGSNEFHAILATPNGLGPAHLLLEHQEALRYLMIDTVTLFMQQPPQANQPELIGLAFGAMPVNYK